MSRAWPLRDERRAIDGPADRLAGHLRRACFSDRSRVQARCPCAASRSSISPTRRARSARCAVRNAASSACAGIEEIPEHVHVDAVVHGRDLDAGDHAHAERRRRGRRAREARGRVVIGDGARADAGGRRRDGRVVRASTGRRRPSCAGADRSRPSTTLRPRLARALTWRRDGRSEGRPAAPSGRRAGARPARGTRESAGRGARAPRRRTRGRCACLRIPRTARRSA